MQKDHETIDNINFIKHLNRLMLEEAEDAIVQDLPGDDLAPPPTTVVEGHDAAGNALAKPVSDPLSAMREKLAIMKKNIQRRRVRMFGARKPIVTVVGEIADTELKIARQQPVAATIAPSLDQRDLDLLREFVEKSE